MTTSFYINSETAWTAMLRAIKNAKQSIYWEIYIFQNDTLATHDFVSALEERARAGVDVRLIADGFGSYLFDKESIKRLTDAGAEVIFYNHPFWRTHRKILVVDERIAFFGGVNVGDMYRKWTDLHVRSISKPVVRGLLITFARFYAHCGGKDENVLRHSQTASEKAAKSSKLSVQELILEHLPNLGKRRLRKVYQEQLARAKESVTIVSPYFEPSQWLKKILKGLRERGVAVEVVLPLHSDPAYADLLNRDSAKELAPDGVRFYFTQQMMHAKALLVDNTVGLVGSQNVDPISFGLTMETGVFLRDEQSLSELRTIIDGWKEGAEQFDLGVHRNRWYLRPLVAMWKAVSWFFNL